MANESVGFPKTAYLFLTVVPSGSLVRDEFVVQVGDGDDQAVAVAAANSHIGYTWWMTYNDAFHINPGIMATLPIPSVWVEDKDVRRSVVALGQEIIQELGNDNIRWQISGTNSTERQSLDFHECVPDTIEEIDRMYLAAIKLPFEPLMTQLRTLRSNSAWKV